jgi:hypothetical protein
VLRINGVCLNGRFGARKSGGDRGGDGSILDVQVRARGEDWILVRRADSGEQGGARWRVEVGVLRVEGLVGDAQGSCMSGGGGGGCELQGVWSGLVGGAGGPWPWFVLGACRYARRVFAFMLGFASVVHTRTRSLTNSRFVCIFDSGTRFVMSTIAAARFLYKQLLISVKR